MNKKNCQFLWNSHHISTPLHSPTITTAPELVLEVNIFPQQSWQSQESKSPSNLSSLKVPSDSESSRRPSNISVCTSEYSGRDFENAPGAQIRELDLTGICQEASSPSLKMKIKMMITMRSIDKSENLIWRRQPIAVSDISVYICLIDIIQKQIQRTTEW